MSDFKMSDYETPDKYVYDTIEELIATENPGLVFVKMVGSVLEFLGTVLTRS